MGNTFQNKPLFQNTINFLGRKVALEDRAREVETKKSELDRIRKMEWNRQDARDSRLRANFLNDRTDQWEHQDTVTAANRTYQEGQQILKEGREAARRKRELAAEEKRYARRQGESDKKFTQRETIKDNNEARRLKRINEERRKELERSNIVSKIKTSGLFTADMTGYNQVDDLDKPIIEYNKAGADKARADNNRAVVTNTGELKKARAKLPDDLKKALDEELITDVDELTSFLTNYKINKYKKVKYNKRGQTSAERGAINNYLKKASDFYATGDKLASEIESGSRKTVGYEKKDVYSINKTKQNLEKQRDILSKYADSIDDPIVKKAYLGKSIEVNERLNKLKADEVALLKMKELNKKDENKLRREAIKSVKKPKLRLNYIENKKEYVEAGYETFDEYYDLVIAEKLSELVAKKENKK